MITIDVFEPLGTFDSIEPGFTWRGMTLDYFNFQLSVAQPGEEIRVRFDCVGGVTNVGIAIGNLLREKSKAGHKTTGAVIGAAYSAAAVALMGCDVIEIAPGAMVMIHEPMGGAFGTEADLLAESARLGQEANNLAGIFAARLGIDAAAARALLLAETWYTADEAVAVGLADSIVNAARHGQTAGLRQFVNFYKHAPKEIKAMAANTPGNPPAATPPATPPAAPPAAPAASVNAAPPAAPPAASPSTASPSPAPAAAAPAASVNALPITGADLVALSANLAGLATSLSAAVEKLTVAAQPPATPQPAAQPGQPPAAPISFEDFARAAITRIEASVNHLRQSSAAPASGGAPPATGGEKRKADFKVAAIPPNSN